MALLGRGAAALGDDGIKRIDVELSLSLFDWGKNLEIDPPERFRPLGEFQPIYLG